MHDPAAFLLTPEKVCALQDEFDRGFRQSGWIAQRQRIPRSIVRAWREIYKFEPDLLKQRQLLAEYYDVG